MMSRQFSVRCTLAVVFSAFALSGVAFGWVGNTHALLCQRNFDLPVVSQFLSGVDQSAIENYVLEPSDASHNVQWVSMTNRSYIYTAPPINGFDWNALDETTRLKYLMHHAGDVSVPAHHQPAGAIYDSTWAEGLCEVAAAGGYTSVGELPNVANTTSYTHNRNGHSYNFTGTIDQVVNTFYNACQDNASWYKSTKNTFLGRSWHWPSDIADANWNGLTIDLMLQRAVFVDYFLAKRKTVATCGGTHDIVPGGLATFEAYGCYDPDNIEWNSNGTYTQRYTTLDLYYWDFNYDGTWDFVDDDPYDARSYDYLIGLGIPTGEWRTFRLSAYDNEGTRGDYYGQLYLYPAGVPEPATLSLLAMGGILALRRRK